MLDEPYTYPSVSYLQEEPEDYTAPVDRWLVKFIFEREPHEYDERLVRSLRHMCRWRAIEWRYSDNRAGATRGAISFIIPFLTTEPWTWGERTQAIWQEFKRVWFEVYGDDPLPFAVNFTSRWGE